MNNKRQKIAYDHLKKLGLFDKYKEALKSAPTSSTVTFSEDGHVSIIGEEGQKFLKKPQIFFSSDYPDGKFVAKPISVIKKIMRKSQYINQSLEDEGYFAKPNPEGGLSLANIGDQFVLSHFSSRNTSETMLDLKISYLETAITALSKGPNCAEGANAIYELGIIEQQLNTYIEYSRTQALIAKKERTKDLNDIIKKLSTKSESARSLWCAFFGHLDDAGFSPSESKTEDRYEYTNNKGMKKSISFSTFSNRLSKSRKIKNTN